MHILGLSLALLIGLSLGLLGAGGSILTVPVFVYILGLDVKSAIAASLIVVGATSLLGAARHWSGGHTRVSLALGFGAVAMVGSYAGARLAELLTGGLQLALFAVVMLASAAAMLRGRPAAPRVRAEPERVVRSAASQSSSRGHRRGGDSDGAASRPLLGLTALAVGALTGLVGVGGGFLIVPALVLMARLPMRQAVGTSLLVIAMNSAAGLTGYLQHVHMAWGPTILFTTIAGAGILAGASLTRFFSPNALRRVFAGFVIVTALAILYESRPRVREWTRASDLQTMSSGSVDQPEAHR
jgi:uncharacterized membrane protein YfcA